MTVGDVPAPLVARIQIQRRGGNRDKSDVSFEVGTSGFNSQVVVDF